MPYVRAVGPGGADKRPATYKFKITWLPFVDNWRKERSRATSAASTAAVAVARGCEVDVVFETGEDSAGSYTGPERPFARVAGINRWRWPADQRDDGAVLHAKLLVIDSRRAFIGSANLTARALHRNLEVGVVTHDRDLAAQLENHVRRLMTAGILRRDP